MSTKICSRSGLSFETENNRLRVHPEISVWTSHRDLDIRYKAVDVIDRGRAEKWPDIESFNAAIKAALNPPPPVRPAYDFEGRWVALIVGYSEKYGYDRTFLEPIDREGRFSRFVYPESGVVETCYRSGKGNDTRYYREILDGKESRILSEAEVNEILGDRPIAEKECEPAEGSKVVQTEKPIGKRGDVVFIGDRHWLIGTVSAVTTYHDEDGISHTGYYPSGVEVIYETHVVTTHLVEATSEQIQNKELADSLNSAAMAAIHRVKEISESSTVRPSKVDSMSGPIIAVGSCLNYDTTYIQIDHEAGVIWTVVYNGRDGDLWDINNCLGGTSIASSQALTAELKTELIELIKVVSSAYPGAVRS